MSDPGHGQLIKAGLLLAAGVAFAVWQWRDLDHARRERERKRTESAPSTHPRGESGPGQDPR
jgi:hypothetical protein